MSSSPESKKTSPGASNVSTTPAVNAATPEAAAPVAATQTASAPVSAATTSTNQQNVQFKTENIGQWAAKQESPFAEQNRRDDEKRKQSAKTRRKVIPAVIAGGVVAVGLVVWGVVMLVISMNKPEPIDDEPPVFQPILNYRDTLQSIYNENKKPTSEGDPDAEADNTAAIDAVAAAVDEAIANDGLDAAGIVDVRLSQMLLYINNKDYNVAADLAQDLLDNYDVPALNQVWCWDVLYQKAAHDENWELAQYYTNQRYQASLVAGGVGGS